MQRNAAVTVELTGLVEVTGGVIKAFRAQEKAVVRVSCAAQRQILVQVRVGIVRGEQEVAGAALGIEAAGHRDSLQQGGFPRSVLADEKGDRLGKYKLLAFQLPDHRQRGEIGVLRRQLAQTNGADVIPIHRCVQHNPRQWRTSPVEYSEPQAQMTSSSEASASARATPSATDSAASACAPCSWSQSESTCASSAR